MDKGSEKKEEKLKKLENKKEGLDNNRINDEKFANKLCCISLFFYLVTIAYKWILPFIRSIFKHVYNNILVHQVINLLYIIIGVVPFASYIIMLIVVIKYPKNKFGKILMIIYNLSIIIFIIWLYIALKQCIDNFSCPG